MTKINSRIAEVAVVAPIDKTLSYAVPDAMVARLQIGCRVKVPLGRRHVVGYIMSWNGEATARLKQIIDVIDPHPLFGAQQADFYLRAARYYDYPPGEAVRTALPAGLSSPESCPVVLEDRLYAAVARDDNPSGSKQQQLLSYIRDHKQVALSRLRDLFPSPHSVLHRLVELDFLTVETVEYCRDPFTHIPVDAHQELDLNSAQEKAVEDIFGALESDGFSTLLLHGVTGSGKTEVYLRAIDRGLSLGRQTIVLVPEIALTPQLVGRFRSWFQKHDISLAVLHSGLSDGERYDAWRQIVKGDADVVIGARSAVFAPLPNLGLIIVDEEHDGSYKQSEGFRYNARDLAQLRGQMEKAVVVLGSATPGLTTYYRSRKDEIRRLELPERTAQRPLPEVSLIDMSEQDGDDLLSQPLKEALAATLAAGEQVLLLLNRRGYAPFLLCHDCGETIRCPNCDITLTYSRVHRIIRCHYCDYQLAPPTTCERCQGTSMLPEGMGTERLEEEIMAVFPEARVARMDRDTTSRKGAHQRLVTRMANGEIDVLIGTQMVAKGHDFPAVTLVGVLNADTALNLPDFRSAERVFSLLSQVAGRAGRGDRPGRVLIQTYATDNYALECVCSHDYRGFAENELSQREVLSYPPFGHLVNVVLSGNDEKKVDAAARQLADALESGDSDVEILGPAPCLLARLRNRHRRQILIKAQTRTPLRRKIAGIKALKKRIPAGVQLSVDVDPVDMF